MCLNGWEGTCRISMPEGAPLLAREARAWGRFTDDLYDSIIDRRLNGRAVELVIEPELRQGGWNGQQVWWPTGRTICTVVF